MIKLFNYKMLMLLIILGLASYSASAATLMDMRFGSSGNIDESVGWDGTTAPGGLLATGLTISSAMKIYGNFATGGSGNVFHVDNWHTGNSIDTRVGITVSAQSGYTFSLGSGSETFSTRLHQHPSGATDMFNAVALYINGNLISSQSYTSGGAAQTLNWNIGVDPLLNNLTSATFDLRFTGVTDTANANHGPEWASGDGAFVSFTGTVIPETSQAVLACLGMGLSFIRRRR